MGEIEANGTMTTTKKKKKKGRPSLLDLQKRSLKQQQQQQQQQTPDFKNPNSLNSSHHHRRSTRRTSNSDIPGFINDDDDDDEDDERTQKKHKLLLGLNSEVALKRRKISPGSDQLGEKAPKATDTLQDLPVESGPTTPLPDKKLLVFILDRLQKKDTYGVYSDPPDPEELPDYYDIIEHPMDFSTLRKKLDGGAYANLEQFEKDVFLLCSNAMQYNSSDTIYFRQARAMQELAKKDFENLRQDSDDGEPQPKIEPKIVRRGRPPGKLKKSLERSPLDRVGPDCSSDATLASVGDNNNGSNGYNLRRTYSYKYQAADVLVRTSHGSHSSETYAAWMSEWENEFPASVLKAVLKYGKKPYAVDENRRDTYKQALASTHEPSNLNFFEAELKQLMAVGLNSEHGYARSLARFAADLGPIVWKAASKKIGSVLPTGLEFGPGWVGEDKVADRQQRIPFSDWQKVSNNSVFNDLSRSQSNATAANSAFTSRCSVRSREDLMENIGGLSSQSELTSTNSITGGVNHVASVLVQQKSTVQSNINGLSGEFGYKNCSPPMGIRRFGIPTVQPNLEHAAVPSQASGIVSTSTSMMCPMPGDDKAKLSEASNGLLHPGNSSATGSNLDSQTMMNAGVGSKSPWQGLSPYHQQEFFQFPPDLNVGFLSPNSPSSSVPVGSPQQPDLVLQL